MHVYGISSCQRHTENLAISTLDRAQTEPESKAPHVLIFPLPAQGHVNSMLKMTATSFRLKMTVTSFVYHELPI